MSHDSEQIIRINESFNNFIKAHNSAIRYIKLTNGEFIESAFSEAIKKMRSISENKLININNLKNLLLELISKDLLYLDTKFLLEINKDLISIPGTNHSDKLEVGDIFIIRTSKIVTKGMFGDSIYGAHFGGRSSLIIMVDNDYSTLNQYNYVEWPHYHISIATYGDDSFQIINGTSPESSKLTNNHPLYEYLCHLHENKKITNIDSIWVSERTGGVGTAIKLLGTHCEELNSKTDAGGPADVSQKSHDEEMIQRKEMIQRFEAHEAHEAHIREEKRLAKDARYMSGTHDSSGAKRTTTTKLAKPKTKLDIKKENEEMLKKLKEFEDKKTDELRKESEQHKLGEYEGKLKNIFDYLNKFIISLFDHYIDLEFLNKFLIDGYNSNTSNSIIPKIKSRKDIITEFLTNDQMSKEKLYNKIYLISLEYISVLTATVFKNNFTIGYLELLKTFNHVFVTDNFKEESSIEDNIELLNTYEIEDSEKLIYLRDLTFYSKLTSLNHMYREIRLLLGLGIYHNIVHCYAIILNTAYYAESRWVIANNAGLNKLEKFINSGDELSINYEKDKREVVEYKIFIIRKIFYDRERVSFLGMTKEEMAANLTDEFANGRGITATQIQILLDRYETMVDKDEIHKYSTRDDGTLSLVDYDELKFSMRAYERNKKGEDPENGWNHRRRLFPYMVPWTRGIQQQSTYLIMFDNFLKELKKFDSLISERTKGNNREIITLIVHLIINLRFKSTIYEDMLTQLRKIDDKLLTVFSQNMVDEFKEYIKIPWSDEEAQKADERVAAAQSAVARVMVSRAPRFVRALSVRDAGRSVMEPQFVRALSALDTGRAPNKCNNATDDVCVDDREWPVTKILENPPTPSDRVAARTEAAAARTESAANLNYRNMQDLAAAALYIHNKTSSKKRGGGSLKFLRTKRRRKKRKKTKRKKYYKSKKNTKKNKDNVK